MNICNIKILKKNFDKPKLFNYPPKTIIIVKSEVQNLLDDYVQANQNIHDQLF